MEKIWQKSYESGIPGEVKVDQYQSLVELLDETLDKYADRPSFHCMGTTLTFKELDEASKKFASYLQNNLNLKRGDRVALMMPNILQYPIALFGVLRAGMIAVNVNPLYTERELEHQLKDSGAKAIVIFANSAKILQSCLDRTFVRHVITTQIGDLLAFPKNLIVNFVIKHVKKMVPAYSISKELSFKDILAQADSRAYKPVSCKLTDTAFLQYTGGTTGLSKGAELTHQNICANIIQAKTWIHNHTVDRHTIITPLPLYHIFSLTANCFTFSSLGGLNVLITNPKDIPGFVKELKKWKFTAVTGVNTLFNALLANEDFSKLDFSSLKLTLGGGMAVQKNTAEKWHEVTGKPLVEAYGLTETSPAACINPLTITGFSGFIGLPISSTEVVIKDDDEKDMPLGERGEICIKGPQVMKGYWNRPEETAAVFTKDGYFKTGDIGIMDEAGYIKLVDRKKDMILVSGFNVYPNEIEDVVCAHPKVFEAAAVGVQDDKSGEAVKIFAVKKDDSLTEDELRGYCKENLTGYKVPRFFEFREDLPKSNVGKILRKELRDPAQQ